MDRGRWLAWAMSGSLLVGPLAPGRATAMQAPGFPGQSPPPLVPGQFGDPNNPLPPGGQLPPGAEVLTRGPIHEAFATPVVFNPVTAVVVPKPPPQGPINEVPPDQRPEGADVEWIPGYWAWDDERQDYIWVSGVWRDIPPGRQWIPGYWSEVQGGFGWTSGFWGPANPTGPLDYLPAPPASLENGPNAPQPGPDFAWAPGSWVWQQSQYNWQPGYWYEARPDWIYNPSTYQATPSGYVYNDGYWDYSLAQRGLPFAPLGFNDPNQFVGGLGGGGFGGVGPINSGVGGFGGNGFGGGGLGGGFGSGFAYTPSIVLPVAGLLSSLFVRPNYGHYYFGDYYAASAPGFAGGNRYVPWFDFRNNNVGYDPIYANLAARRGREPGWDQAYRTDYRNRFDHPELRPRPTFAGQQAFFNHNPGLGGGGRPLGLAEPLGQWARNPGLNRAIVPVGGEHRQELVRRQNELANFQHLRAEQERQGRFAEANRNLPGQQAQRALFRNDLPRSPIAAAANPRFGGRGPVQAPGFPGGQAAFRPQFNPQHNEVPLVTHRPGEFPGGGANREGQFRQQAMAEQEHRRIEQVREQQVRQGQAREQQVREQERRQGEERGRREGGRPR